MKKLAYINVLRGMAILMVVAFHAMSQGNGAYKMHPYLISIINEGARGVQLFFLVSAFTLFRSQNYRSRFEETPIKNFFIRRFFRIAPMYYLTILYYLFFYSFFQAVWAGNHPIITSLNVTASMLFINSFSPYWITSPVLGGWTVGIEMIFYCLLPVCFFYIKNTRQAFNFFILTLLFRIIIVNSLMWHPFIKDNTLWNIFLFFCFPNQLFVFALGILMHFIIDDNYQIKVSPISVMFLSLLLGLEYIFNSGFFISKFLLISFCFLIFAIALSRYQPKILLNNFFIYAGKISYSLYLIHFPIFHWMNKFHLTDFINVSNSITALANYILKLVLDLIFCIPIASLCYNFIEQPFIKIAEKAIKYNPRSIIKNQNDESF